MSPGQVRREPEERLLKRPWYWWAFRIWFACWLLGLCFLGYDMRLHVTWVVLEVEGLIVGLNYSCAASFDAALRSAPQAHEPGNGVN